MHNFLPRIRAFSEKNAQFWSKMQILDFGLKWALKKIWLRKLTSLFSDTIFYVNFFLDKNKI